METWFIVVTSLCVAALIKVLFNLLHPTKNYNHRLPPAPSVIHIIANSSLLLKTTLELISFIRSFQSKVGPIVSLSIGSKTFIFISDRTIAHQALIQNGAVFADRPPAGAVDRVRSSNQHSINSAAYGPLWRLLRRNLMAEILHPSRLKSYSHARKWVLQILLDRFNSKSKSGGPMLLLEHFQYAMFCLLALMCFGDKLDEKKIKEVEDVQRLTVVNKKRFRVLNFWPGLTKILFRKRWEEFWKMRQQQEAVYMPLIRERRKIKEERLSEAKQDDKNAEDEYVLAYVDTLFELQLPEEKRKLNENEIKSLCSEFLGGGTHTTSTAMEWIMANLVKYPHIQEKLFSEIKGVVGDADREVNEDDLRKMPYLKAIILESLRRHPPAFYLPPHAVTEDLVLGGYLVPKKASINFMVVDIGRDSKVWDDPMAFKPERFLNSEGNIGEVFDITGSREINMMPFGVGRRICPGLGLAMLHLEYFVANFVWSYEWKAVDGDDVSLEEKHEITVMMKHPLKAYLNPRLK